MKITDIKQYGNNAKQHPIDQVQAIADSIKKFGCLSPILLDKNNEIVAGHGRYLAFRDVLEYEVVEEKAMAVKGEKVIPVQYVTKLTKNEIKAFRLADNLLNQMTGFDTTLLTEEVELLKEDGYDDSIPGFNESLLNDPKEVSGGKEIGMDDLDDNSRIVLSFSSKDYLEALELLGAFKEQYEHETNEEAILSMLRQMA
jgi:hypothetical protein